MTQVEKLNPTIVALLPKLEIKELTSFSGIVPYVTVERPISIDDNYHEIGAAIGLWAWLGLTDLHSENIAFGYVNGRLQFFPLDLEMMFYNLTNLHDTLLTGPRKIGWIKMVGLEILKKYKLSHTAISAIADSFCSTLFQLKTLEGIKSSFVKTNFSGLHSRVILRATGDYVEQLNSQRIKDSDFIESELIQLERKDIPYFFKFFGKEDIYYFSSPGTPQKIENIKTYYLSETRNSWAEWTNSKIDLFSEQLVLFMKENND